MMGIKWLYLNGLDCCGYSTSINRIVIPITVLASKSPENIKSFLIPIAKHSMVRNESIPMVGISQQISPGTTEPIFFKVPPHPLPFRHQSLYPRSPRGCSSTLVLRDNINGSVRSVKGCDGSCQSWIVVCLGFACSGNRDLLTRDIIL
jgi:hypothetical protein